MCIVLPANLSANPANGKIEKKDIADCTFSCTRPDFFFNTEKKLDWSCMIEHLSPANDDTYYVPTNVFISNWTLPVSYNYYEHTLSTVSCTSINKKKILAHFIHACMHACMCVPSRTELRLLLVLLLDGKNIVRSFSKKTTSRQLLL